MKLVAEERKYLPTKASKAMVIPVLEASYRLHGHRPGDPKKDLDEILSVLHVMGYVVVPRGMLMTVKYTAKEIDKYADAYEKEK